MLTNKQDDSKPFERAASVEDCASSCVGVDQELLSASSGRNQINEADHYGTDVWAFHSALC